MNKGKKINKPNGTLIETVVNRIKRVDPELKALIARIKVYRQKT